MLSGNSEVCCLNKDTHDANDNLIIECDKQESGSVVSGATAFYLKSQKLNSYVYTSKYNNFHEGNCGSRCPITGQLEVSAVNSKNANCRWKVEAGVFVDEDFEDGKVDSEEKWIYEEGEKQVDEIGSEL